MLVATVIILITRGSDQYIEIPDNPHPLVNLVQIPDAKPQDDNGGIYYVDVLLRRASLLESLVSVVRPEGSDLIDSNQILDPGISDQERVKLDRASMKQSQEVASVVAMRQLGYRVPIRAGGVRVVAVTSGSHATGLVKPGDVIISANGKPVHTRIDLSRVAARLEPGDIVKIVV
ncbi:MAG: PDZ domain-containing protein, partial [Gaiellaceae bacterium]